MNWDIVKGNWNQLKGKVQEEFGHITDDDHAVIAGDRNQFVGKLQEKYGYVKEEAEKHVDAFLHRHGSTTPGVQTGGVAADGTPDTRGITEKVADAVTGDHIDDKTGKPV